MKLSWNSSLQTRKIILQEPQIKSFWAEILTMINTIFVNQFGSSSLLRSGVDLSQMYNIKVHNNAKHSE